MHGMHAPRRITLGTLAVLLTVLLSGLVTPPAHAEDNRLPQVNAANQAVADCAANGGEPDVDVEEDYGWVSVDCVYDDHQEYCFYYYDGTTSCGIIYNGTPPRHGHWDLPPTATDPVLDGGGTQPPAATDPPSVTDPGGSDDQSGVAPPTNNADQHQDSNQNAKHGKQGKKGGKHHKR